MPCIDAITPSFAKRGMSSVRSDICRRSGFADNTTPAVLSKSDAKAGQWIESGSHIMLMPKDPASLDKYPSDFNSGEPYVMFKGTKYAHIMIPSGEGYFKYQGK